MIRVRRLFPGKDGVSRIAGLIRRIEQRTLNKLCPLLHEDGSEITHQIDTDSPWPQDVYAISEGACGAPKGDAMMGDTKRH